MPSSQTEHKEGEKVAMLHIPKIKKKFSIYWGADDATLKKGVGMFVSDVTTTPSEGTYCTKWAPGYGLYRFRRVKRKRHSYFRV